RTLTDQLQLQQGRVIPYVFHRQGVRLKSFAKSWKRATIAAGVPGRIFHDTRRSAVRLMERAGVPRSTAMRLVGHKTESVYRRYWIREEVMLREGAAKIPAYTGNRLGKVLGKVKQVLGDGVSQLGETMVGRDGIEPPTPGFSVLRIGSRTAGPTDAVLAERTAVDLDNLVVLHEAIADSLAELEPTPLHSPRLVSASTNPGIWTQRSPLGSCAISTLRPSESCKP